ncbi:regulator of G-protein signaling 9-binding protein [Polypterus senegalus]
MLSRWRRSVGELLAAQEAVKECRKGWSSLTQVTACFQQLTLCLGGSSDCGPLREELEEARRKTHQLSSGLQIRLTNLLTNGKLNTRDREDMERLWVLFLSSMELFQQDLNKAFHLLILFPLNSSKDTQALVSTGLGAYRTDGGNRAATIQLPWGTTEGEELPDICIHIVKLDAMIQQMMQTVNIPIWAVEATQAPWVEVSDQAIEADGTTSEEILAIEEESNRCRRWYCCDRRCRLGRLSCMTS